MTIVGGRKFEAGRVEVLQQMRGEHPEPIERHLVEMLETVFPPKQVVAIVTGWPRMSFSNQEAQRVLTKLGFRCRTARVDESGTMRWDMEPGRDSTENDGLVSVRLAVAEQAIASLLRRIGDLEART